jgi:hypothetical protein
MGNCVDLYLGDSTPDIHSAHNGLELNNIQTHASRASRQVSELNASVNRLESNVKFITSDVA